MVWHEVKNTFGSRDREYFFVVGNQSASKIKVASFKERATQSAPFQTVYEEENAKIISMTKKGKFLYILTDAYVL